MDHFAGVIRLERRRLLGSARVDKGELTVGDGGFHFTGKRGEVIGRDVRRVTVKLPEGGIGRLLYEIEHGDPSDPSTALFAFGDAARPESSALTVALDQLMPMAPLSPDQYERVRFPPRCICCLAPATGLRRCEPGSFSAFVGMSLRRTFRFTVPPFEAPYCDSHLVGFEACQSMEALVLTDRSFWRRWDEAELADPRLRESRPYVNLRSAPRFGPDPRPPHTVCWLGLRLDAVLVARRYAVGNEEIVLESLVFRFQNPGYTQLFSDLNPAGESS
jgi:hypothetical protein